MADGTDITIEAQDTTFTRNGYTGQTMLFQGTGPGIPTIPSTYIPVTKPPFTTSPNLGLSQLAEIYNVGPFDTLFEAATIPSYNNAWAIAFATVQSGPSTVRGGTARAAFAVAEMTTQMALQRYEAIWKYQVEWAGKVVEAITQANEILDKDDSSVLHDNEQSIMAQKANSDSSIGQYGQLNAYASNIIQSFTAGRHYGTSLMSTQEVIAGQGIQNGVVNGFGMSSWR